MNRRQFLHGVSAVPVVLAGCSSSTQEPTRKLTVPSLSVRNHEPRSATVTTVLTDASGTVHLWQTVELDAHSDDGTVDVHEFESTWVEPRDYQLLLRWREADETFSERIADLPMIDECAPLLVTLDDGFQFSVAIEACPDTE